MNRCRAGRFGLRTSGRLDGIQSLRVRVATALCLLVLVAMQLVAASSVQAQKRKGRRPPPEPAVRVSLVPLGDAEHPYRYRVALELAAWEAADIVADRRLLVLRVRSNEGGAWRVCKHMDAPNKVDARRIRHLASDQRWEEWVDLRMLCWGRALDALERGATVQVSYGFRQRGRDRWVVREPIAAESETAEASRADSRTTKARKARRVRRKKVKTISRLAADDTQFVPAAKPGVGGADTPVIVSMEPAEGDDFDSLRFVVALVAREGTVVIYPRFDLWRFHVRDADGQQQECGQRRMTIVPIIDFYSKIGTRRGWREAFDPSRFCMKGFSAPGVYEVSPIVDLVYGGERAGLTNVVTGSFQGEPVAVRISAKGRYIEQPIEGSAAVD